MVLREAVRYKEAAAASSRHPGNKLSWNIATPYLLVNVSIKILKLFKMTAQTYCNQCHRLYFGCVYMWVTRKIEEILPGHRCGIEERAPIGWYVWDVWTSGFVSWGKIVLHKCDDCIYSYISVSFSVIFRKRFARRKEQILKNDWFPTLKWQYVNI